MAGREIEDHRANAKHNAHRAETPQERGKRSHVEEAASFARSKEAAKVTSAAQTDCIALQHSYGNRAVQRLLAPSVQASTIQLAPTPLGANVAMRDPEARERLLNELLSGTKEIAQYTGGSCYDAVAYIRYLQGRITFDDLSTTGIGLVGVMGLDSGRHWKGEEIPRGSAVGFRRVQDAPGFFHAAVSVGGTSVRGVNQFALSPGWGEVVDITAHLPATNTAGTYSFDGQPIQVWYQP